MNTRIAFLIVLGLIALTLVGCGTATPTPVPLPTQPPAVITVVITVTPPPPTATSAAPIITPLPTMPLTTTLPGNTPVTQPTAGTVAQTTPKPAATKKPTTAPVPAASPTATAIPLKYAAPVLIEPLWTDSQKDERKFPSQALVFKWRAVAGLQGDECYLLSLTFSSVNPGGPSPKGDYFLSNCADQTRIDYPVSFTLYQPNRGSPNYSSLMIDTSDIWIDYTITLVKKLGQCVDDYHCKTAPVSPASKGRLLLRGS